jgi:hypothetical protein
MKKAGLLWLCLFSCFLTMPESGVRFRMIIIINHAAFTCAIIRPFGKVVTMHTLKLLQGFDSLWLWLTAHPAARLTNAGE